MSLISDHLRFMTSVDIGDFSFWDIKKSQFQFLVTFLAVFLWSVNCTNHFYISLRILTIGNALFEGY